MYLLDFYVDSSNATDLDFNEFVIHYIWIDLKTRTLQMIIRLLKEISSHFTCINFLKYSLPVLTPSDKLLERQKKYLQRDLEITSLLIVMICYPMK